MAAAPAYRQSARAICEAKGCTTMPVDGSGLQFRGDGIHVDRSDRTMGGNLHRLVEASVCGALAQPPKR